MSTLGKRKQRGDPEPREEHHGSMLFVSNLPYTATSTDLQTLFSDLAPVRSAFVVTEHGTGVSKGVGYVSFATREDAEAAMKEVGEKSLVLQGRGLRVAWAASKKKDKKSKAENDVKEEDADVKSKAKVRQPPRPSTMRDPDAIRTVIVSGLPPGVDQKAIWKKFRKQPGAERVAWPAPVPGGEDPSAAHVLFDHATHAFDAVQKVHAHVFKGALLSATLKKRLDGVAAPPASSPAKAKGGPAPSRASRLIVRNLPFDVSEQDLRALFLPYGTIYSVHVPQAAPPTREGKADNHGEVKEEDRDASVPRLRGKGFAFVWMWTKREAEKAMEGVNGKMVRAGMAEEMVRDKQVRKKARRQAKKAKGGEEDEGLGEDGNGARIVAVDWALSKDRWEEEKQKMGEADDEEGDEEGDEDEDEDSEDEDEEGDEEDSHVGLHDDNDAEDEDATTEDEEDDRSDADERAKPQLPAPEAGTTLFVRNIPFEATEDELRTLYVRFSSCSRLLVGTSAGRSGRLRGTGFACFWNTDDADKAVEQSAILRAETTGQTEAPKRNPFAMPSILTPDPSAPSAHTLVLHGRTLDVVRAVTRDEATRLKEEGEKAREKADKRNMYLLREGVILPNTPAATTLPPAELEKRTNSFNARRTLLKSNPSLYVSKTRLSIRNLPRTVNEALLKCMARHALREFEADVRAGRREGLSVEERAADKEEVERESGEGQEKEKGGRGKKKAGRVRQAKVVREQGRVDARTGAGRSKGYGFLELRRHADALRVLRWANNNPELARLWDAWEGEERDAQEKGKRKGAAEKGGGAAKDVEGTAVHTGKEDGEERKARGTLIVEFSIENVQVVQRRAAKESAARSKGKEQPKPRERLALPKREVDADADVGKARKRRRLEGGKAKVKDEGAEDKPEKKGKNIGSLIGRKRKERKAR
ncbi:hypothetical protein K488DRAFT_38076, partial [Vararia minispora EC-137]